MTSTVVKAKFKGTRDEKATYVANICAPRMPMVSGMPSIVNMDENNICTILVENCAPYDITLERGDILGIMETEEEELVPLMDDFISFVCQGIHNCFPKVKRKDYPGKKSNDDVIGKYQRSSRSGTWTFCANTRMLSALTDTIWAWPRISSTRYISNAGSSLPEAVQNSGSAPPIHQTNSG
jgi:hypothetical protein